MFVLRRKNLCKMLVISLIILMICFVELISYAATSTITVDGTSYSLNTGDGSDGDVEFRIDGMYVNGMKKCGPDAKTPTVYTESFESGYQYWSNVTGDDSDWTRYTGKTPDYSYKTGTNAAYAGSYYVYTEADGYYNKTFLLESIALNNSGKVSFMYSMYGSNMGSLYLEGYNGSSWTVLKTISGNQDSGWKSSGDISFSNMKKLRFRGVTGNGYRSDMCLDSITITLYSTDAMKAYSDQFESIHSDISYSSVYTFENITQYLPVHKTYNPSTTVPGGGTVPNFNNLTIKQGVVLRGSAKSVNFSVQEKLTVEGLLMTKHGDGGTVSYYGNAKNGSNAGGSILIAANEISVAPNGTNASKGAIMTGWGGGGAGSQYTSSSDTYKQGGNGGAGGGVVIYANTITNKGEIRAGNGGGGGGGAYAYNANGGSGGAGGNLTCVSKSFSGSGVYASGFGGGGGSCSGEGWSSSVRCPGVGGYGGGGNGGGDSEKYYIAQDGKSANTSIMGYGGYTTITASQGSGPAGGNGSHPDIGGSGTGGTGGTNGVLNILCDGDINGGIYELGYTEAGGTSLAYTGGVIMAKKGEQTKKIVGRKIEGQFPLCKICVQYNSNYKDYYNDMPTVKTTIKGSEICIKGSNNYITNINASKITIDGALNLVKPNILTIPSGDIVFTSKSSFAKMAVTSGSSSTGIQLGDLNIGTSSSPINSLKCYAPIGTEHYYVTYIGYYDTSIKIYTSGDARFINNKYKDDTWCKSQNITINDLKLRGILPSSAPNSMGINEVNFSDWIDKYNNPSGTLPIMKFIVEKQLEGDTEWTATKPFDRNLSGLPMWQDMNTVPGKTITYRVGFKNASSTLGFIYMDSNTTNSTSEGGLGIDSTYNGQGAAYWAYQNATPVIKIIKGIPFTECLYDKLVDKSTELIQNKTQNDYITLMPTKVENSDYIYTRVVGKVSTIDLSKDDPIKVYLVGKRLLIFKVIDMPKPGQTINVIFK